MEEFTYWEARAVKMPVGPILGTIVGPVIGLILIGISSAFFGGMQMEQKKVASGPTIEELKAIEAIVATGDPTKMTETIRKDGQKINADADKWALVSSWKNKTLFDLYQADLLAGIRGQIEALERVREAAAKAAKERAAAGGGQPAAP